jgi:aerobic carbon-monoxide dehydrogenase small subunit
MVDVQLEVNGEKIRVTVEPHWTLLHLLRQVLHLTGTRSGCEMGDCGACTVILNGRAVNACLVLAVETEGCSIETIEGLAKNGKLHPIQQAFIDHGAIQCGFCTPGMVMAAKAFLNKTPSPTEDEVRHGIAGNICRCTGYSKIVEAVLAASQETVSER